MLPWCWRWCAHKHEIWAWDCLDNKSAWVVVAEEHGPIQNTSTFDRMLCNTDMPFKFIIYRMRSPHVISISAFRSISIVHACCCLAIPFPFRVCVHAVFMDRVQSPNVISSSVTSRQSCSCMFLSCHSISIPFLVSCSSVRIPSTLLRGLLMGSILHHLAGRHVSTEQQRS